MQLLCCQFLPRGYKTQSWPVSSLLCSKRETRCQIYSTWTIRADPQSERYSGGLARRFSRALARRLKTSERWCSLAFHRLSLLQSRESPIWNPYAWPALLSMGLCWSWPGCHTSEARRLWWSSFGLTAQPPGILQTNPFLEHLRYAQSFKLWSWRHCASFMILALGENLPVC